MTALKPDQNIGPCFVLLQERPELVVVGSAGVLLALAVAETA